MAAPKYSFLSLWQPAFQRMGILGVDLCEDKAKGSLGKLPFIEKLIFVSFLKKIYLAALGLSCVMWDLWCGILTL